MIVGIIGAMKEEIILLKNELSNLESIQMGARTFYSGELGSVRIVMCLSGWGKAAAASTTTTLINQFGVDKLFFIGLAGALQDTLKIGDIVIGNQLCQHDFDLRDFSDLGSIRPPFYKDYTFNVSKEMIALGESTATDFVKNVSAGAYPHVDSNYKPSIHVGPIGTGDQFVGSNNKKAHILSQHPQLVCTEMEGGAIAQIAYDYEIPFAIIRIVSDHASETGHDDFVQFLFHNISSISVEFIKILISKIN